jgi:hypothetical protein
MNDTLESIFDRTFGKINESESHDCFVEDGQKQATCDFFASLADLTDEELLSALLS